MHDYAHVRALITSATAVPRVRRWVRDYLTEVAAGRVQVTAVRHPLGFVCFPVWRGGDLGVCIHVWCEGARVRPTTSAIHAHSWDLLSFVLYGTVANEIIEVGGDARPTHRVYEIHSGADGDRVCATPRLVGYRLRSRQLFRGGETYRLPHGVFHVSDVRGSAATVVLGEYRPGCPDRSLGTLAVGDHRVHRTLCAAAETGRVARAVLDRLDDPAAPRELEERCHRASS